MIKLDNKILRNLEEQVGQNQLDIADIKESSLLLAQFGIKIVGEVETESELPDPANYPGEYGDAYIVGTQNPFDYHIFTRPNNQHTSAFWFNIGEFPLPGPQGPQGIQGEKGETGTGSIWYTGTTNPTITANVNDQYLNTTDGSVFTYSLAGWTRIGYIKGPQGPQGPKGDTGDVGGFINIHGIVTSTSDVPTPQSIGDLTVAYLVGTQTPYTLYIQVGSTSEEAIWTNMGPLNVATYVTVNGEFQNTWNSDTKLDKISTENQVYTTNGGITYGKTPVAENIPQFSENGTLKSGTPISDDDVVNKAYFDANAGGGSQLYLHNIELQKNVGGPNKYYFSLILPTATPIQTTAQLKEHITFPFFVWNYYASDSGPQNDGKIFREKRLFMSFSTDSYVTREYHISTPTITDGVLTFSTTYKTESLQVKADQVITLT